MLLAGQSGSLLNTNELSNTLKLSVTAVENYAFIRLREKYNAESIKFWRTTAGNEVDFVIDNHSIANNEALEIKFNSVSVNKKKYKKFIESYPEFNLQFRSYLASNNSEDIMGL